VWFSRVAWLRCCMTQPWTECVANDRSEHTPMQQVGLAQWWVMSAREESVFPVRRAMLCG
jgi:hypothetical protein